jgi:LacI family transcriptional regulator
MKALLGSTQPPDAVFACNDPAAAGAWRALTEAGLQIPADVSLIGYGDTDLAHSLDLSTVRQFPERLAREAIRLLLNPGPLRAADSVEISPELVVRGSTSARRTP